MRTQPKPMVRVRNLTDKPMMGTWPGGIFDLEASNVEYCRDRGEIEVVVEDDAAIDSAAPYAKPQG